MQRKLMKNLMLVLTLVVLCVAMGMTASAETWGDYEYTVLEDGTVEINDYFGEIDITEIKIPNKIDEKKVTQIGKNSFWGKEYLTRVILPEGIIHIGDAAFFKCHNLEYINIPDSVETIGTGAFSACKLTTIHLPENVRYIDECPFNGCVYLTSITVDEGNPHYSNDNCGVLFNKDKSVLIQYPAGNLRTTYEMPDSVTAVATGAFNYSMNLTNVKFSQNLLSIEEQAFVYCLMLTEVIIPESVESIGAGAFGWCINFTSIVIPKGIQSIGEMAFVVTPFAERVVIKGF